MLPVSASSPGERGLRASSSGSKARLRLAGLGVEMEPKPLNLGEEVLWPEKLVEEEQEEEEDEDEEEEEEEGLWPGDPEEEVEEEEEELSPHCSGKGKGLPGGEGEEARIRTACQRGWAPRLGTSGLGELELLWQTSLRKATPEEEGGLRPVRTGREARLLGDDLWMVRLRRTKPGVGQPLRTAGPIGLARLRRAGPDPDARLRRAGPGGLARLLRAGPNPDARLLEAGPRADARLR